VPNVACNNGGLSGGFWEARLFYTQSTADKGRLKHPTQGFELATPAELFSFV
jgi:hypothetical protein